MTSWRVRIGDKNSDSGDEPVRSTPAIDAERRVVDTEIRTLHGLSGASAAAHRVGSVADRGSWRAPTLKADLLHTMPEWLNQLRTRGNDLSRAGDWQGLWDAREELRTDEWFWADLWGPYCAVAGRHLGEPGALELLTELVDAGFSQPELLGGALEAAFGEDPAWPALAGAMSAPRSAPWLELTAWPVAPVSRPVELFALNESRAAALREMLPPSDPGAWATARALLRWVSSRWVHADAHMEVDDAVACLERVDAGERFACVEYALVLSQALNARRIPSRRLMLRQARYDVGLGHGHVVSEAWIDELGKWVVLDAQNALYWVDGNGRPLSAPELQQTVTTGQSTMEMADPEDELPSEASQTWWRSYFASVTTTGGTWATGSFVPIFQREGAVIAAPLLDAPDALYPDLGAIQAAVQLREGAPVIELWSPHPYVTGFAATDRATGRRFVIETTDPVIPLELEPGVHEVDLAVVTPYTDLRPQLLAYTVRG
jgi:hypothetical protein